MERVKPARNNFYGISSLDESRLSSLIPTYTFPGGTTVKSPSTTLYLWRSTATQKARDGTLCFFLDDSRLEPLWARPERYAVEFKRFGIAALVEPDFSLWVDDPIEEQLHNVKRKKIVSRIWQEHGLFVIPCLNWATEESFAFCFAGIPQHAPVCATECRTAGGNDDDRRAFLAGLSEGVWQVQPQHLVVYGGEEHKFWLADRLPAGPTYTLLEVWTSARGKIRKTEKRQEREKNQLTFGGEQWADVAPAVAA
jgi:hypothetical protein